MGEQEEILESGKPLVLRWRRLAALIIAGLAVGALLVVREWPRSPPTDRPGAVGSHSPSAVPSAAPATPPSEAWPTAPQACGGTADLPIVSSAPAEERTGLRLLVGGDRLRAVDFDGGRAVALAQLRRRPDEFVVGLLAGSQTVAWTGTCSTTGLAAGSRLVRIGADSSTSIAELPSSIGTVLADGPTTWGVTFPDDQHPNGSVVPLDGGSRVRLPAGFWPSAIAGGALVGSLDFAPRSVILVDAATGRVRADIGAGDAVAAGRGMVMWAVGCDVSIDKPCMLRRWSAAGADGSYRLPRSPGATTGVISVDGRLLALTLERAAQDPRYLQGHPIPPADIAVLDLDTGALDVVPGIEIPAKEAPGLAFSPDGRWLAIALNAGTSTRLLAWRHGLARPYETRAIAGPVWGPPAIVVRPPGG